MCRPSEHEAWRLALNRVRRIPGPRTAAGKVTPYRGLESYGVRDAAWFVGREHFVDQLQAEVGGLFDADGPRLVTLVGASGTGKSSLLRAGLMARLAMEGVTPVLLTPGSDPQRSLAAALARFRPDTRKRLVVVDQLEEVFYDDVSPAVREEFLTAIIALADEDATVVVTALRADFYGHAVEGPTLLPVLRRHQVLVGPMDPDSLRRVVVEPARRAGATVEPELVELVLRDLSPRGAAPDASALPMMSHALLATWKQARNARLRVSDYVAVGGVAGAVQRTAEQVYGSLDEDGRATARWLFSQLVNVDEDGVATRRRVETRDLAQRDALTPVIEAFVAGRILTATDHTLEISHEVLLTVWPRLGEWLTADREVLRLRRRIGLAAQAWEESGREPEGLLRGTLLDLARPLFDDPSPRLTALERSFVAESLAHEADIVRVQRRRALGMRSLFAVVAALALIATTLSIYLVQAVGEADEQRVAAEQARNRALSRQVAVQASKLQETAPTLASQLSLAAYELAPTVEARSGLLSSTGGTQVSRLVGPEGTMAAVASLDGRIIATVHSDGVVRFWAAAGGAAPTQVAELPAAEGGELYAAAFSPDGRLFATAGAAGVVTVVDMGDPSRPVAWSEPLTGPESAVHSLAFSSNGRTLYAGTSDPALFRWVLGSGERSALQRPVTRFGGPVQSVATSSTGLVAAGSADGFVRVWRIRPTGLSPVYRLSVGAPTNFVHSVAFSPDGRLLAAGAKDKRVRVWRMHTGNLVTDELGGFTSWVNSVAFSQDGHALAAGASGGLVRVWRTRAWLPARSLQGPTNFTSVQFVPSGDVLTGSIDGSARIYHLAGPQLPPFGDNVWGVATPASGDLVYVGVGSGDPQVARIGVMNPGSPHVGVPLLAPASAGALDGVVGVSPDGSTVAAGTATGQVVVWNVAESGETDVGRGPRDRHPADREHRVQRRREHLRGLVRRRQHHGLRDRRKRGPEQAEHGAHRLAGHGGGAQPGLLSPRGRRRRQPRAPLAPGRVRGRGRRDARGLQELRPCHGLLSRRAAARGRQRGRDRPAVGRHQPEGAGTGREAARGCDGHRVRHRLGPLGRAARGSERGRHPVAVVVRPGRRRAVRPAGEPRRRGLPGRVPSLGPGVRRWRQRAGDVLGDRRGSGRGGGVPDRGRTDQRGGVGAVRPRRGVRPTLHLSPRPGPWPP